MEFKLLGTTYIFPDQMQPPSERENIPASTEGLAIPNTGRRHVRSASHGGVSLLNPVIQCQPTGPAAAIGLLEAATGQAKTERSSQDPIGTTSLKPPYTGQYLTEYIA